jgi:serine/threonine protein kinase
MRRRAKGTRRERCASSASSRSHYSRVARTRLPGAPGAPADQQNDDLFLAIEDIDGETLEEYVFREYRRGVCLPSHRVADFDIQLASMLGKMHDSGYANRDLKPTNVIVAPNGRLRFVDFEMARS